MTRKIFYNLNSIIITFIALSCSGITKHRIYKKKAESFKNRYYEECSILSKITSSSSYKNKFTLCSKSTTLSNLCKYGIFVTCFLENIFSKKVEALPFLKSYKADSGLIIGNAAISSSDNSIVGVGYSNVLGSSNFYIGKYDEETGTNLWSKIYEDGGTSSANSIIETEDTNYVVVGNIDSDILVGKLDQNGDEIWFKSFGLSDTQVGLSILETVGGNLVVVGQTRSGSQSNRVLLFKIDQNGDSIWNITIDGFQRLQDEGSRANAIIIQSAFDNSLILTGQTPFESSTILDTRMLVSKFDIDSNLIWAKRYISLGNTGSDAGRSLIEKDNGNLIVVGETRDPDKGKFLITEIYSNGTSIKAGKYKTASGFDSFQYAHKMNNQSLAVIGYTNGLPGSSYEFLLGQFNENGSLNWFKFFGEQGFFNNAKLNGLDINNKNEIIGIGYSSLSTTSLLLTTLPSDGVIKNCTTDPDIEETLGILEDFNFTLGINTTSLIISNLNLNANDITLNETVECIVTESPTNAPTSSPSVAPSGSPTLSPSGSPSQPPTITPSFSPTLTPTGSPSQPPTLTPTGSPTQPPTESPTDSPTFSPTKSPTGSPTQPPTLAPTYSPTISPTISPTFSPTNAPTNPTTDPTLSPTNSPTPPTPSPTPFPSYAPTNSTISPSEAPFMEEEEEDGLNAGEITGIVLGSIFLLALPFLIWFCLKQIKTFQRENYQAKQLAIYQAHTIQFEPINK